MDAEFMQSIASGDAPLRADVRHSLSAGAKFQLERFTNPQSSEYDVQVAMLVDFFHRYGGFNAYANAFRYAFQQDGLQWASVSKDSKFTGDDNYGKNLSEYVIAYLHLGFGATSNLTPAFVQAGVGSKDTRIPSYVLDANNVKSIADAHCSIAAARASGFDVKRQLSALQKGDFQRAATTGGTKTACPSECTFSNNKCVAKF